MIQRIKNHLFTFDKNGKERIEAAHYKLSDEAMMLMLQSNRGYSSISDMKKRKHSTNLLEGRPAYAIDFRQDSVQENRLKSELLEAIRQIESMDTGLDDYREFSLGLQQLETVEFQIFKHYALSTLNKAGKAAGILNLPGGCFYAHYKLLKSGRIQSIPYLLYGNSFLRFLRPSFDKHLEYGKLMYLDYATQEIRLLAVKSNDSNLLDLVMYEPDLNAFFQEQIFNGIDKSLSKRLRSAWSYGSRGGGKLIEPTRDYLKSIKSEERPAAFIRRHFRALDHAFPAVAVYREEIAQQWLSDGFLIAPGGIKRGLDDGVLKKDGTPSIAKLRRKGLSHVVQGYGAWIARRLIADARYMKDAILLFPVHDGFVFYLPNDHLTSAYLEARKLMDKAASDVVPVPMPHKIEWVWGQDGPIDVLEFEKIFRDPHSGIYYPQSNIQIPHSGHLQPENTHHMVNES